MSGKSLFNKGDSKSSPPPEEISGYLGKETTFEGKINFEGVFRLDGKFEGEIFEGGTLIVGEMAVVKGRIAVQVLVINGHVEAEVHAKSRVEIHSTGKLYGTLFTPTLTIQEGGILDGQCKMEQTSEKGDGLDRLTPRIDQPSV